MQLLRIIFVIILMIILFFMDLFGKEYRLEIEFLFPDSLKSHHINNCNPDCAHENNGGWGMQIGIGGTINFSLVYIELTNSYGDHGTVSAIEPMKADFRWKFVRAEVAVWIMRIEGYKDENGNGVITKATWPKFELGLNPLYMFESPASDIFINYNYFDFISVQIHYISIGYYRRF